MLRHLIMIGIAMLAMMTAPDARADYWTSHADITCSRKGNVALIRFGGAEDEEPIKFRRLPVTIDGGLSRSKPSGRKDCSLPNGWRLRLRNGDRQSFAYGMGGADPPAFFSLWINQRKVFSAKEWKPGYGNDNKPWITALVVRPDRLTWCRAPYDISTEGPQRCVTERFQLDAKYRLDTVEYPPNGRKWNTGTLLASSVSAPKGFCSRYIRTMRAPMLDGVAFDFALFGHEKAPFTWDIPFRDVPNSDIRQAEVEIAPGMRRTILMKHGTNHFFDGDVVVVLPPGTATTALIPQMEFPDTGPDTFSLVPERGWTLLIGGRPGIYPKVSPRYVHFFPERIAGRLYFLASPTNARNTPTALLIGLDPLGGARVMCRIRRIEPHY
ncbi:MAG TPA: hypothetical protein VN137_01990 [Sphingomonas sp.]|nr:hypothetical protein [Sphingomonas sp.]